MNHINNEATITLKKEGLSYKLVWEEKDYSDNFGNPISPLRVHLAKNYNVINNPSIHPKKLTIVLDGFDIEGGTRTFRIQKIYNNAYSIVRVVRIKNEEKVYRVTNGPSVITSILNLFSEFFYQLELGQIPSTEETRIEIEFAC